MHMARRSNHVQVFVSSPFFEYDPATLGTGDCDLLRFKIRGTVASRLRKLGYRPWRWEIEEKRAKAANPKASPAEIIEQAIRDSGLVLVIYQRRAGSFLVGHPFHATAFEIVQAVRYQKPIWLYVLGREHSSRLIYDLGALGDPLFLGSEVEFCDAPRDLLASLEQRLQSFVPGNSLEKSQRAYAVQGIAPEEFSVDMCEQLTDSVQRLLVTDEYAAARLLLEHVPLALPVGLTGKHKRAFARLLALCGHVLANSLEFRSSIQAITVSAKIYAQLEDWFGFFARIQEISGALNMEGDTRAWSVNSFGLQGVCRDPTRLGNLREGFYDSRASMLMTYGRLGFAEKRMRQNIELQESRGTGPSPYSISKLGRILSYTRLPRNLDAAQRLVAEIALPSAIGQGHSTGYVLNAATEVFIASENGRLASACAAASIEYCLRKGYLHTLSETLHLLPYIA